MKKTDIPGAGKDVERLELLCAADGDVKGSGHIRKQAGSFLKG